MVKAAFNNMNAISIGKLGLNWRKKVVQGYIWSTTVFGDEILTLGIVHQKYPEIYEMLW